MNCTTMKNPCRTIQYVIDFVAISNDVIKIDGSFRIFHVPHEIRMFFCRNITFTSYNGVVWIHTDRQRYQEVIMYGIFLTITNPNKIAKCEIHFNSIKFRETKLARSDSLHVPQFLVNLALTVKNCLFQFTSPPSKVFTQTLIAIQNQHSFITMDNCTINLNCKLGIVQYSVLNDKCKKLPLTQIILRNTQIENAMYTVDASKFDCYHAEFEVVSSKLSVINSRVRSTEKCSWQIPQFAFYVRTYAVYKDLLAIHMENSRFENLLPVMAIRGGSAFISNCTFKGNVEHKGGALHFQSKWLKIENSHFYENEAQKTTYCHLKNKGGTGGAIYLDGKDKFAVVEIYNSSFINNKAACDGSSVYLGFASTLVVRKTLFITRFTSSSDTIWVSRTYHLTLDDVSFEASEDSKLGGVLFAASVYRLSLSERMPIFNCPNGSMLRTLNSKDGFYNYNQVACQYCQKGTYTLTSSKRSGRNDTKLTQNEMQPLCHSCTFGAICQRGIKPKPNFWGYVHKSTAFMILCPPGYCCQTSDQCTSLNSCNSNRAGRLCGECKHGYFQSVFTHDCLEEKVCKTGKFWTVAIIACLMFTVMFIFLQDKFFCIVKILNIDNIASLFKRRVSWLCEMLPLMRRRGKNESYGDRDGDEVERNDEPDIHEGINQSRNNSTAAGLIKIVFFFYQTHSLLTLYKSNKEIQYFTDLKTVVLSIFTLHAQVPLNREFHCPLYGMGSITKVLIKALFPVICLVFAGFLHLCAYTLPHLFSISQFIQEYSTKAKPKLLTGVLQLTLLGYSTLISSTLSLVTCISLSKGSKILYIDGNLSCYQPWEYAVLTFIVLWAVPLIYALHKLPSYMRTGELSIRGFYAAVLLPLPFAVYSIGRSVRKIRLGVSGETSNGHCQASFISYLKMKPTNIAMSKLLYVIEGPFRFKTSGEEGEKLSWEPVLLLQRIILSLCHTFVLKPGMRSLVLLLFIIMFLSMNFWYRPFSSGFLNATNGFVFILLCITGLINAIHAFIYEYGSVPYGPLVQLLDIFDYVEVTMVMLFPVTALVILIMLVVAKFLVFFTSVISFLSAKCERTDDNDL